MPPGSPWLNRSQSAQERVSQAEFDRLERNVSPLAPSLAYDRRQGRRKKTVTPNNSSVGMRAPACAPMNFQNQHVQAPVGCEPPPVAACTFSFRFQTGLSAIHAA